MSSTKPKIALYNQNTFTKLKSIIQKTGLSLLKFHKKIQIPSNQSVVGLLEYKGEYNIFDDSSQNVKFSRELFLTTKPVETKVLFKISNVNNFLTNHENAICETLENQTYLPNFMRSYAVMKNISLNINKDNPFSGKKLSSDVLLAEYIDHFETLHNCIKTKLLSPKCINSILNQICLSLLIVQEEVSFIHNDLHFDNILICECLPTTYLLYIFIINNEVKTAIIPTFGFYPCFIDFGFAYTKEMNGLPIYSGIHHDNNGYINFDFDHFTDFKTLLVRLSGYNYNFGKGSDVNTDYKRKIEQSLIQKLPINSNTGWDVNNYKSVSENIEIFYLAYFKNRNDKFESIFSEDISIFSDIISSLCYLPIENKTYDDMYYNLDGFFNEWRKIEKWLNFNEATLVLKNMVCHIRSDYEREDTGLVDDYVTKFEQNIKNAMSSISERYILESLNFNNLYKYIIKVSESHEGLLHKFSTKSINRKKKEFSNLEQKTSLDMYGLIEEHITENFENKKGDYFIIINSINKTPSSFILNDEDIIQKLNTTPHLDKSALLYSLL